MRVKIIIKMMDMEEHDTNQIRVRHAEVFSGELDIAPKGEYLTKISILAEGYEHPICDVPFSPLEGYWSWHSSEAGDDPELEAREIKMIQSVIEETPESPM